MMDVLIWIGTFGILAVLSAVAAVILVGAFLLALGTVREARRRTRVRAERRLTDADRRFLVGQGIRPW